MRLAPAARAQRAWLPPAVAALAVPLLAWSAPAPARTPLEQAVVEDSEPPHTRPTDCPAWLQQGAQYLERLEERLVALVNDERLRRGRAPLAPDARLARVAREHAQRMAAEGRMSHRAGGSVVDERLHRAGILDWDAAGENLATAYRVNYSSVNSGTAVPRRGRHVACHDPDTLAFDVVRAWLASDGHRQALLDERYTHVGSAAALSERDAAVYVTHDFARLVQCGYAGAPCCPPPAGLAGGVCQIPTRCHAGWCLLEPPAQEPSAQQPSAAPR